MRVTKAMQEHAGPRLTIARTSTRTDWAAVGDSLRMMTAVRCQHEMVHVRIGICTSSIKALNAVTSVPQAHLRHSYPRGCRCDCAGRL